MASPAGAPPVGDAFASFELPPLEGPPANAPAPTPEADAAAITVAEMEQAISAARAEADAIREAARAEGHAEGLAAAQDELQAASGALTAALAGLEEEREALAARTESAAVELAFAIAEQMLCAALEVQPERVVDVVRGALRRLVERERVTVLVHPEDLELVRAAAPELVAELGGIEHCEVQAERRVTRGGAVVRTGEGEVDATLSTKLALVRDAVAAELAGESDA